MFVREESLKFGGGVCSIVVHAGAGYHSLDNEKQHLDACDNAARAGMAVLRSGGSAVDAVEMAIKSLEDTEITNAGFGSNLTLDGTVECDASIVDCLGRSGGVGAVSQIRNPISLARHLYEHSLRPLPLRRIPPSFLVGDRAVDYATEWGIPILPHDYLVSLGAWQRYQCATVDLWDAQQGSNPHMFLGFERHEPTKPGSRDEYVQIAHNSVVKFRLQELRHRGCPPQQPMGGPQAAPAQVNPKRLTSSATGAQTCRGSSQDAWEATLTKAQNRSQSRYNSLSLDGDMVEQSQFTSATSQPSHRVEPQRQFHEIGTPAHLQPASPTRSRQSTASSKGPPRKRQKDRITDTVGVIAIDSAGHMAAGSSSGGIGLKIPGRIGPAALVGSGTTIIPKSATDEDETSVAVVTSGSGEHINSTNASFVCAERLYYNVAKSASGKLEEANEETVMDHFIKRDFMSHPSVVHSSTGAAVGVLAVKKTKQGAYVHFAHNTDSFALACMHQQEKNPICTMSRRTGKGQVSRGARAMRNRETHKISQRPRALKSN